VFLLVESEPPELLCEAADVVIRENRSAAARNVILKVMLPGTAALNERLHQGALGLHGVHQIVGGPFVEQLVHRDDAELLVAGLARQVMHLPLPQLERAPFARQRRMEVGRVGARRPVDHHAFVRGCQRLAVLQDQQRPLPLLPTEPCVPFRHSR